MSHIRSLAHAAAFLLLAVPALGIVPPAASAQVFDAVPVTDRCEPPISTCGGRESFDARDCPLGYACTCVPSCPGCKDCDARVCVRDPGRECKTACDCEPGLGCFDGQCIAGVAPVFCCDARTCPAGEQCQHRDGRFDRCPRVDPDPSCRERVEKVSKAIAELVHRTNECRRDSDCVRIDTSTECLGTCGAFINGAYARRAARRINDLDRRICGDFLEDGCPFATPACQAQRPACVQNRCTGVPILPSPPRPPFPIEVERPDGVLKELEARR